MQEKSLQNIEMYKYTFVNMCQCVHVIAHVCLSMCEFACVQAFQIDQWACQYSWSLCVFSQCNHGNGAVQTGRLHWGFESHNVATARSFIMPWVTVTGQQTDTWTHFMDRIEFRGLQVRPYYISTVKNSSFVCTCECWVNDIIKTSVYEIWLIFCFVEWHGKLCFYELL